MRKYFRRAQNASLVVSMDKTTVILMAAAILTGLTLVPSTIAQAEPDWADHEFPWVQPDEVADEPVPFLDLEGFSATTLDDETMYFAIQIHDLTGASGNLAYDVFFAVGGEDYQMPFIATWAGGSVVEQLPLTWNGGGTNVLAGWEVLEGENLIVLEADVGAISGLEPGTPLEAIEADSRVVTALGHVRDTATPSEQPLDYPYGLGSALYAPGGEDTVIEETLEGDQVDLEHEFTESTNVTYRYNWTAAAAGPYEASTNVSMEAGSVEMVVMDADNQSVLNRSWEGQENETTPLEEAVTGDWVINLTFKEAVGTFRLNISVPEDPQGPEEAGQNGEGENEGTGSGGGAVGGNQTDGNATIEEEGFLPGVSPALVVLSVIVFVALAMGRRNRQNA